MEDELASSILSEDCKIANASANPLKFLIQARAPHPDTPLSQKLHGTIGGISLKMKSDSEIRHDDRVQHSRRKIVGTGRENELTSGSGDGQSIRTEASSLAMQNKGGILLAFAGLAVGFVASSPLLALVGIAAGFAAGNLGIDGNDSIVAGLAGRRHTAPANSESARTKEGSLPIAHHPSASLDPNVVRSPATQDLCAVSFDEKFSQENGAFVAPSGPIARTGSHER